MMDKSTNNIIEFYKELEFCEQEEKILEDLYKNEALEDILDGLLNFEKEVQND
jgi:hypothetical protein